MPRALAARFPDLRLPRLDFGGGGTPVGELGDLPIPAGCRLFCKREDRAGTVYGGNKVRKLEFLLARARAEGAAGVVTVGAVGSHHVLATCVYGATVGLRTHAVLVAHPASAHARRNAEVVVDRAASVWPAPSTATLPVAVASAMARARRDGRAFLIPPGGSSPLGALGAVDLGLEIAADVQAGRLPAPDQVYVALGSGGTAAGLWVGLRLGGLGAEVVAVRVVGRVAANLPAVRVLAERTAALLPERPALSGLRVNHGFAGTGYGLVEPRASVAMAVAEWCGGLSLEATYTAKAFAACLSDLRAGRAGPVALFVDTVNSRPLEPLVTGEPRPLPPPIARLLR